MLKIEDLKEVSRSIVAKLFRCTSTNINRLVERGMPQLKNGRYDLFEVVGWRLDEIALMGGKAESKEAQKWLIRWRRSKALRDEFAHKREAGDFVPVEAVKGEYQARLQVLVAGLLAYTDRLPPLLAGKSREEIRETLADETELLMHAFYQKGQYTPAIAEEVLAELGGKTNRLRRNEKCDWYQRQQREKTNDSTTS